MPHRFAVIGLDHRHIYELTCPVDPGSSVVLQRVGVKPLRVTEREVQLVAYSVEKLDSR